MTFRTSQGSAATVHTSEVGKFMIIWCQISRGYRVSKIIEIGWFLTELFKK